MPDADEAEPALNPWEPGPAPRAAAVLDDDFYTAAWQERSATRTRWAARSTASEWFAEHGGVEAEIPDLEFRAPHCPICDEETDVEDGEFSCSHCMVSWDSRGESGSINRDQVAVAALAADLRDLPTCGAVRTARGTLDDDRPCRLSAPHEGIEHTDGSWTW